MLIVQTTTGENGNIIVAIEEAALIRDCEVETDRADLINLTFEQLGFQ